FGVSVPLILRLEKMNNLLYRIGVLIEITDRHAEGNSRLAASKELLIEIVRTHRTRQSILALFRTNFDIFSRKLVQHAGETGEHYITRTKKEYWAMFRAGAGGGIITVITTLAKFSISALKLPLFIEGIAVWINYSASFLTMQAFGFALATKQPSMTAAALAGRLSEKLDRSRLTEFVNEIARISRSQFIAAVGNVGLVIPTAFLVDFAYFKWSGNHVLSSYYAAKTLETLHPWKSATVLYAAFTGVLLWIASFGAGWLQNWVIYRQIPEAIASQRKLQVALGEKRAHALGEWVRHNAAGWGGNIAIGFLLAFVPLVGTVSGLPLDIRHVTLTAGTMTFAVSALDISMINANLIATCCLTVALIGLMNFSVSMACALIVAVRARRVRKVWFHALLAEARRFFLKRPLPFFFPTE
ncbi:MAG TPA: hypothetical protein VM432_05245, partial [Bdellovibrionales bacterium]|nr:hypothetical protein [Bdellovibrionales bacterium]